MYSLNKGDRWLLPEEINKKILIESYRKEIDPEYATNIENVAVISIAGIRDILHYQHKRINSFVNSVDFKRNKTTKSWYVLQLLLGSFHYEELKSEQNRKIFLATIQTFRIL